MAMVDEQFSNGSTETTTTNGVRRYRLTRKCVTHRDVTHVAESAATAKRAVGVAPEVRAVTMESHTRTEVNVKEVFQVQQNQ